MSTLRAHYDGQAFVPDEPVNLPEGTQVRITVQPTDGDSALQELADLAEREPITDSPPDWSEQHDHYIRGTPKQ